LRANLCTQPFEGPIGEKHSLYSQVVFSTLLSFFQFIVALINELLETYSLILLRVVARGSSIQSVRMPVKHLKAK